MWQRNPYVGGSLASSGISHWRKRIGSKLDALLVESLRVAHATGALKTSDLARVTIDTTVQPKDVTHPTDAKLTLRAIDKLGAQAKAHGLKLRQSYARLAKHAAQMAGRYTHAKQFKRANRMLKFLRTRLGRLIRDITRKIDGDERLTGLFAESLSKAHRIRWQNQYQRGPKLYSWHAPEVECIGKGKAHKPYEFGVKVSITTTIAAARAANSCSTPRRSPAIPTTGTGTPSLRRSRTPKNSQGGSSSAPTSTRGTAAIARRSQDASSSPARSAAFTASSSANSGDAQPSSP